jgi:hypothetical protein
MSDLTHVELLWLEKRIENWIRFGRVAEEQILDKRRRVVSFTPGSIFAFVRWTSNDFGTVISRIDILRAVAPGQRCTTVPYIRPGGDILLRLSGWPKVERVLQIIDSVEMLGIDPSDVAPDYWHHVHNRLSVNEVPRSYAPRGRPDIRARSLAAAAGTGRDRRLDVAGMLRFYLQRVRLVGASSSWPGSFAIRVSDFVRRRFRNTSRISNVRASPVTVPTHECSTLILMMLIRRLLWRGATMTGIIFASRFRPRTRPRWRTFALLLAN